MVGFDSLFEVIGATSFWKGLISGIGIETFISAEAFSKPAPFLNCADDKNCSTAYDKDSNDGIYKNALYLSELIILLINILTEAHF